MDGMNKETIWTNRSVPEEYEDVLIESEERNDEDDEIDSTDEYSDEDVDFHDFS